MTKTTTQKKIIQHLTPEAAHELVKHASDFRFAISQDYFLQGKSADDLDAQHNLPAGFFIQRHPDDNSLVLCFDRGRVHEPSNNPFAIVVHQELPTEEAKKHTGAYQNKLQQPLLDCFKLDLSNENNRQKTITALKQYAKSLHPDVSDAFLSHFFDDFSEKKYSCFCSNHVPI